MPLILKADVTDTALEQYKREYPLATRDALRRILIGFQILEGARSYYCDHNGARFYFKRARGHRNAGAGRYVLIHVSFYNANFGG